MIMTAPHIPVLLKESVEHLGVHSGARYIDCTVGAGGHAAAILEASAPDGRLLGLDTDPAALAIARTALARFGSRVRLVNENFRGVGKVAREKKFLGAQGVLFDLGISSMQLAGTRGFSFQRAEPLDMRLDPHIHQTADEL